MDIEETENKGEPMKLPEELPQEDKWFNFTLGKNIPKTKQVKIWLKKVENQVWGKMEREDKKRYKQWIEFLKETKITG